MNISSPFHKNRIIRTLGARKCWCKLNNALQWPRNRHATSYEYVIITSQNQASTCMHYSPETKHWSHSNTTYINNYYRAKFNNFMHSPAQKKKKKTEPSSNPTKSNDEKRERKKRVSIWREWRPEKEERVVWFEESEWVKLSWEGGGL